MDLVGNGTPDIISPGDINIVWEKNTPDHQKLGAVSNRLSITQLVGNPSRITNTGHSKRDHIYINNRLSKLPA